MSMDLIAAVSDPYWQDIDPDLRQAIDALVARLKESETEVREVERERDAAEAAMCVLCEGDWGLERYGVEWRGPKEPIAVPMADGYWTPWHLAQARIARLERAIDVAIARLSS